MDYITLIKLMDCDGIYYINGFLFDNEYDCLIPEGEKTAHDVRCTLTVKADSDEYKFITNGENPKKIVAKVKIKMVEG